MIKAIIFDFFGVLLLDGREPNRQLLDLIRHELKPVYKISVLSNASRDYAKEYLDKTDYELFDDILPAFAHGMPKPQAGIYNLASQRLKVRPEECLFTDDNSGLCEGAVAAGMKSVYFYNVEDFRKEIKKILAAGPDN